MSKVYMQILDIKYLGNVDARDVGGVDVDDRYVGGTGLGVKDVKIPHTGDTNSLDRCGQQDRYKFEEVA